MHTSWEWRERKWKREKKGGVFLNQTFKSGCRAGFQGTGQNINTHRPAQASLKLAFFLPQLQSVESTGMCYYAWLTFSFDVY